jgi:hypothetical protein
LTISMLGCKKTSAEAGVDCGPRWNFLKDMNHDGVYSISDLWIQIKYVLFAPGDGVICLIAQDQRLSTFLELGNHSYGNWFSVIVSLVSWPLALVIVLAILASIAPR